MTNNETGQEAPFLYGCAVCNGANYICTCSPMNTKLPLYTSTPDYDAGLEAAAKVCENKAARLRKILETHHAQLGDGNRLVAYDLCATDIRALKTGEKG